MQGKLNAEPVRIVPVEDEVEAISSMPLVGALSDYPFVAVHTRVMNGSQFICNARSHTMARRISNALQAYTPGPKGY